MGKADAWPAADSVIPYLFDPDQKSGTGCEDPTMFRGKNGSLHMLLHKYQNGAPPGWPGLHAFSADGYNAHAAALTSSWLFHCSAEMLRFVCRGLTWHVSKQVDGKGAYSFEVEWQQPARTASTIFQRRECARNTNQA